MPQLTLSATGDYLPTLRIPPGHKGFERISSILKATDCAVTNLEMLILDEGEGHANAISGGTHLRTTPDRLDDLKAYGFHLVGTANNHVLDYGIDGLLAHRRHLRAAGIVSSGSGAHLSEASRAAFHDSPNGRVALISVVSTAHRTWHASRQRADIAGRPGVNGLRHLKSMAVSAEQFRALREIAELTETNNMVDLQIREGFISQLPDGQLPFGADLYGYPQIYHVAGESEPHGLSTLPHPGDMVRLTRVIEDAALQADCVIVNFHAHEMKGDDKTQPADFVHTAARAFIDAGAHAVIGHGPHVVRGIEIYANRLICYSTGDFVFQDETLAALPQEWYDEHAAVDAESGRRVPFSGTPGDEKDRVTIQQGMHTLAAAAGENWLSDSWDAMHGFLPVWKQNADGDVTEVTVHPLDLGRRLPVSRKGFPTVAEGDEGRRLLGEIAERSAPYGTALTVSEDGSHAKVLLDPA